MNSEAYSNLGGVLDLQGKLTESMAAYDRALTIAPGLATAHLNRGDALRQMAQFARALDLVTDRGV